jgi:hypothetical protein
MKKARPESIGGVGEGHGSADPAHEADEGLVREIDALLAEFGGDPRAVIAALLHDLAVLAQDAEASTSRGYVRGRVVRLKPGRAGRA